MMGMSLKTESRSLDGYKGSVVNPASLITTALRDMPVPRPLIADGCWGLIQILLAD